MKTNNKKEFQERLCHLIDQFNPECSALKNWLKVHLPDCEYCQGFFVGLLEKSNKK